MCRVNVYFIDICDAFFRPFLYRNPKDTKPTRTAVANCE